ncbi:hypothetical protein B0T16DRAFT_308508, partial [Cercophora newfieldiana]
LLLCTIPPALASLQPLFALPGPPLPGSWFENLAVRPNGAILATRGDAPEIWQIDPSTRTGSRLVSVEGAFNLTGISQVDTSARQGKDETYVFASAYIPAPFQVGPGSAKVWTLTFTSTGPSVSLLKALPEAGFLNGLTAWDTGRVLIGDTLAESVYLIDVETGVHTTPLVNMSGVNGVRVAKAEPGVVYWANHNDLTLRRVKTDGNAVPTGAVEVLAGNLTGIDDFALQVGKSGKVEKAYIAGLTGNDVVEVVLGTGAKRVVGSDLTGTGAGLVTAVVLGRRKEDEKVLYASAGQGG